MPHSDPTPDDRELLLNTLPQSSLNTFPQPIFDTESVPVFYMFVQSDGQQPTSSSRMMENIQESQLSENDSNTYSPTTAIHAPESRFRIARSGAWLSRHLDPEGKYTPRTWTKAPPEQHTVTYEGTRYGHRRLQTMAHNPRTRLFELKHSPIQSPTFIPVRRLRGTAHVTKICLILLFYIV